MMSRTLIPYFQASTMSDDGGPNIFTSQALARFPGFVEDGDRAIGLDLAKEMDPSSGNRQRIGQLQDLFGSQAMNAFVPLCLLRSHLVQKRWCILGHIPIDEGWTGTTDLCEGGEASALPKGARPQAVQFFDLAIVLGLSDRQEDQFDAQRQTQPYELPEDARRFVPAAEGSIVVELQKVRDSQGFPSVEAVCPNRLVAFVDGNRLRASACAQIQCMKGIDLETLFEIPACPIQRMQSARHHLQGFGEVCPSRLDRSGNQTTLAQYSFDGGERRQGFVSHYFAYLAPDRSSTD